MHSKNTDDLCQELMEKDNLDSYLQTNCTQFLHQDIAELLTALYDKKSISKAALARESGMSEVYLHQVFSGRRRPSRDRILCLCIGLNATLEETRLLLKRAGYAQLYPKLQRDAIVIHGLIHHTPLTVINDNLFARNEKTLF